MNVEKEKKKLEKALFEKATGYTTQEVIEEYGLSGDDFVLQKRKTSTKSYPPDLTALQILLEGKEEVRNKYSEMSNEDLEKEKLRLIKLLKEKK
ncbi:MAG: hypothetical protein IJW59_01885 [Clostridia bacterium]|nr:hypothetical protein [Clostridia bacterium]